MKIEENVYFFAIIFLLSVTITTTTTTIVVAAYYDDDGEKYIINHNVTDILVSNVSRVIDGDTIVLEYGGINNDKRIRLAIVDTPERGEQGYKEATKFTTDKCLNKIGFVFIDHKQKQSYNRDVGLVYCVDKYINMTFLNKELLDTGHAEIYKYYCKPNKSEFRNLLCNNNNNNK